VADIYAKVNFSFFLFPSYIGFYRNAAPPLPKLDELKIKVNILKSFVELAKENLQKNPYHGRRLSFECTS
jgi:hypothetical protein